jgi:hypothetical protein
MAWYIPESFTKHDEHWARFRHSRAVLMV